MKVELDQALVNDIKKIVKAYDENSSKEKLQSILKASIFSLKQLVKCIDKEKNEFNEYVEELANSIY